MRRLAAHSAKNLGGAVYLGKILRFSQDDTNRTALGLEGVAISQGYFGLRSPRRCWSAKATSPCVATPASLAGQALRNAARPHQAGCDATLRRSDDSSLRSTRGRGAASPLRRRLRPPQRNFVAREGGSPGRSGRRLRPREPAKQREVGAPKVGRVRPDRRRLGKSAGPVTLASILSLGCGVAASPEPRFHRGAGKGGAGSRPRTPEVTPSASIP